MIVHAARMHIFLFAQLSHTNYHLEQELTSNPKYKKLRLIRRRLLHLYLGAVVGLYGKMAGLRRFSCPHANDSEGELRRETTLLIKSK